MINKLSVDHIGVLVHQHFNGSIPRPAEGADHLALGDVVKFKITKLYTPETTSILSFNGTLLDDS